MLDIKFIRENTAQVKQGIKDKGHDPKVVDAVLEKDDERRSLIGQIEKLRAERNDLNDKLKNGRDDALIKQSVKLKKQLEDLEPQLRLVEKEYTDLMLQVPGIPLPEVPVGKNAKDNQVLRIWGVKKEFDFTPRNHIELGKALDIIDFDRGSKVSGFRGYYLKNDAVLLQFALMQYTLKKFIEHGYTPMTPPVILKKRAFVNSGHFPWGIHETYKFETDQDDPTEQFLAGTAEVPLVSYYQDEVLNAKDLPIRLIGYSPCFRKEAGNYGKDTKGVYRVHEFVKTEQVVICKNDLEESRRLHDEMLALTEEIAQDLDLPYRVLLMCTGDMGEPQAKKYDLEAWMPGRGDWGELASDSIMLDFQSRRANVRYRDPKGEMQFVHMLNNTASNSPRWLVAILENYQQADGSVKIPAPLVPYIGKEEIKGA